MPISKKSQNIFSAFWWLLWVSAIVLLEGYYRDQTGERLKVTQGQYWFFAIALLSDLGLVISLKEWFLENFFLFKSLMFSFGLLFLALTLSAFFGINAAYGLRLSVILIITSFPFVLLGVRSHSMADEKKLTPLLIVSVVCALGACILSATGPVSFFGVTLENNLMNTRRWAFLFNEANGLAGMMALGVTLTLFQIIVSQSRMIKWSLGLLVLPVIVFVFWKTNSRGSLLWLLVTLFFYCGLLVWNFAVKCETAGKERFFLPALSSIIGFSMLLLIIYRQNLVAFLRFDQADLTTGRMEIWLMYLEQLKSHPLLGFGFGASDELMTDFVVTGPYPITGPLNVFVGILGETGLLGFMAMLLLWVGAILKAWKAFQSRLSRQDGKYHYAFFLMVTLISLVAHQNGEWQLIRITPINFLFFFLVGAAWTLPRQAKIQSNNTISTAKLS